MKNLSENNVVTNVCNWYGVHPQNLHGSRLATWQKSECRQVAIFFLRVYEDMPLQMIADIFGCSHTTVLYSVDKITENLDNDIYNDWLTRLKKQIYGS